jgi:hypothetical protein
MKAMAEPTEKTRMLFRFNRLPWFYCRVVSLIFGYFLHFSAVLDLSLMFFLTRQEPEETLERAR